MKESQALATETVALVRTWLTEAEAFPVDSSAKQLAGVVKDPAGLAFTVGFVDGVVRPEDLRVAAANLAMDMTVLIVLVESTADEGVFVFFDQNADGTADMAIFLDNCSATTGAAADNTFDNTDWDQFI